MNIFSQPDSFQWFETPQFYIPMGVLAAIIIIKLVTYFGVKLFKKHIIDADKPKR